MLCFGGGGRFWDTQPMKKPGEDLDEPGEIETKTIDDVKAEPYNMPPGFEWCHVDVMDAAEAEVRKRKLLLLLLSLLLLLLFLVLIAILRIYHEEIYEIYYEEGVRLWSRAVVAQQIVRLQPTRLERRPTGCQNCRRSLW